MNLTIERKEKALAELKEILSNDESFAKDILNEIKADLRRRKVDSIIDEDFKEFEDVFKALA